MARTATIHVCSACGHGEPRWLGQCPGCGEWNTLIEERAPAAPSRGRGAGTRVPEPVATPVVLRDLRGTATARIETGVDELDRVLGGGILPGSLTLLGGEPGIGKSTLTGMALGRLVAAGSEVLYISGEESAAQIRLRHERLQAPDCDALGVPVLAETDLPTVLATIAHHRPAVCVVDSIQTLHDPELSGAPGSVGQVREACGRILRVAKGSGSAVLLVGHVTKEGAIAGPRVLEHLVDAVLQFDGERERFYRTLRALKNRFGSTNETGVFEMRECGLRCVRDPSARFTKEATGKPGSAILAAMEGSRPLLVEVQALVHPSELEQPRRVCNGIDRTRLAMVLAVLGRHAKVHTGSADVFVNVVGGVRIDEPGADLAVALAVASAARGTALAGSTAGTPPACFGELGLTGELRSVGHAERRRAEAAKFGLDPVICPERAPTIGRALRVAFDTGS